MSRREPDLRTMSNRLGHLLEAYRLRLVVLVDLASRLRDHGYLYDGCLIRAAFFLAGRLEGLRRAVDWLANFDACTRKGLHALGRATTSLVEGQYHVVTILERNVEDALWWSHATNLAAAASKRFERRRFSPTSLVGRPSVWERIEQLPSDEEVARGPV